MKEQYECRNDVAEPCKYEFVCIDCSLHLINDQRLIVKRAEYDRLKEIEAKYEALCNRMAYPPTPFPAAG